MHNEQLAEDIKLEELKVFKVPPNKSSVKYNMITLQYEDSYDGKNSNTTTTPSSTVRRFRRTRSDTSSRRWSTMITACR